MSKKVHILLVDDDDDHAELIAFHLERRGFEDGQTVERVKDGEEALAYLFAQGTHKRPDLILMDINLPKVSGLEVLSRIKNDPLFRTIPVILLTTSESPKDLRNAYLNFANSYLIKPPDFDQFSEMICALSQYWGRWNCLLEDDGT